MDLREIARAQRTRQVLDALESERDREAALQEQLHETVAELEGPSVDEEAFARLAPEDVDIVRETLLGAADSFEEEFAEGFREEWLGELGEDDESPEPDRAERLGEAARLDAEIAKSRRRQQALERYLEALGGAQA